jgi:hypothetical protein
MKCLTLCALSVLFLAGCTPQAERPAPATDDALPALQAKAALVELARDKPEIFEGLDADTLADTALQKGELPHTFILGAFTINVRSHWYSADIGGLAWHQFYHGTFTEDDKGHWTANEPIVTTAEL